MASQAEQRQSDWSTSYAQYLARSAALSTRTLNLYQVALEHVSRGQLPATVFADHYPRFAQAHAQSYSTQLAEIGTRFFSELMRLSATFARNGNSEAPPEPEIHPPHFDANNPARWYEQVAEYAGQLNARALKAYRTQLDRVANGETTPSEAQQRSTEYLSQQVPEYLQQMTALYFDLLNGMNDVRANYEEAYFRGILIAAQNGDAEAAVLLTLSGTPGATARASLAVTNTTQHAASIGFRVTDVRRMDGVGPALVPKIAMEPATLQLGPGDEGTLAFSVVLDPNIYEPGAIYCGTLTVSGGPDLQVEVQLRIFAASEAWNAQSHQPA